MFVDAPQVDASGFREDFLAPGSEQDERTSAVRFTGATFDESVVLEAGDEALVPTPMYVTYEATVRASGARLVPVPARPEASFRPSADALEAAHAAGCQCIAVTNSVPAQDLADADLVVTTLAEVDLPVLRRLLSC